jgi:fatty-acyl-CoA synthase
MSLWQRFEAAGRNQTGLHCWLGARYDTTPWGAVVAEAERTTAGLRRLGVAPGERVAGLLTNTPEVVRGMLGVWLAGGVLASLPLRARGMSAEEHAAQVAAICDQLEPCVLLVDHASADQLPDWLGDRVRIARWESLVDSGRVEAVPPGVDEVAFVQYSSGSTGTPKGCMLTPRAIANQLDLIMEMMAGVPGEETCVSWLPLSHDMGLFGGLLTPLVRDIDLYLSSPQRFALLPRSWFADVAATGATITVGTNTALAYATRPYRARTLGGSLDRLRVCIVGAERVEWDTLREVTDTFAPYGFDETCLMPAYGLAEATLAVTATPVSERPRYLSVDAIALADGMIAEAPDDSPSAAKIVSAGTPCRGVEVSGLSGGELKEVQVRSPSLTCGYYADAERTRQVLRPEGLATGDLGFTRDGYLYLVGRSDDMIHIAGRNVYTREIETAVEAVDGIRRGTATLIEQRGIGRPRLTLLIERRAAGPRLDYAATAAKVAAVAMAKAAVCLDQCVFLALGSLPKTPSGKIQRRRCVQLLESGRLVPLATVEL